MNASQEKCECQSTQGLKNKLMCAMLAYYSEDIAFDVPLFCSLKLLGINENDWNILHDAREKYRRYNQQGVCENTEYQIEIRE